MTPINLAMTIKFKSVPLLPLGYSGHEIEVETHEKSSQNRSSTQASYPEVVQGKKSVFKQ